MRCVCNQLTSLDVSNNAALQVLECDINQLTSLNVSNNAELLSLSCGMNEQLGTLDLCKTNKLQYLECTGNTALQTLDVHYCANLEELYCAMTGISSLDVSQNTTLRRLSCQTTAIDRLNLSNNSNLEFLDIAGTHLKWIDLSANSNLKQLRTWASGITALDIRPCPYLVNTVKSGSRTVVPQSGAIEERVRYELQNGDITMCLDNYSTLDSYIIEDDYNQMILPENLQRIQAEAFAETSVEDVVFPENENCSIIESRAFADCDQLRIVHISPGVTQIAEDAFENSEYVVLSCEEEGYGIQFSQMHGIPYIVYGVPYVR